MDFFLQSNFILLLSLLVVGSFLNSWGGVSKGPAASSIAGAGLFLQIGCVIAAFIFIGWRGAIAIVIAALLVWPLGGYVTAWIWVKMRPQAKLLTPSLAAHLCGLAPEKRDYKLEDVNARKLIIKISNDFVFTALFHMFNVPLSEAEEIQ